MHQLNEKKEMSRRKAEFLLVVGFTILLLIVTWSKVVYVPLSNDRILDLSLVPLMFAAMIGGYKVAIPVGTAWGFMCFFNLPMYDLHWIMITKLSFAISLVYFYIIFKKAYKYSPWNVYRTIVASLIVKALVVGMATAMMFPDTPSDVWLKENLIAFTIELAICILAMRLLIEKLREIHVLNGVKRKEKVQHEERRIAYHQQNKQTSHQDI